MKKNIKKTTSTYSTSERFQNIEKLIESGFCVISSEVLHVQASGKKDKMFLLFFPLSTMYYLVSDKHVDTFLQRRPNSYLNRHNMKADLGLYKDDDENFYHLFCHAALFESDSPEEWDAYVVYMILNNKKWDRTNHPKENHYSTFAVSMEKFYGMKVSYGRLKPRFEKVG